MSQSIIQAERDTQKEFCEGATQAIAGQTSVLKKIPDNNAAQMEASMEARRVASAKEAAAVEQQCIEPRPIEFDSWKRELEKWPGRAAQIVKLERARERARRARQETAPPALGTRSTRASTPQTRWVSLDLALHLRSAGNQSQEVTVEEQRRALGAIELAQKQ